MNVPPPEPTTVLALTLSAPAGIGVDYSRRVGEDQSLAAQATYLLAMADVALVYRRAWPAGRWGGPYIAAGPYVIWSPVLFPEPLALAPGVLVSLGWQWRPTGALVLSAELGGAALYVPKGSEGGGGYLSALPRPQVRVGWGW
jgi:hypothetical protein